MRDLAVFGFFAVSIGLTIRRPWLGVLVLAVFSYLNPHRYAWGFALNLPLFQMLFIAVALFTLACKDRQPIPKDWRITTFYLLWAYFFFTTTQALVAYAAWPKLIFVSKIYLPLIFTLILINTREKLYYLIITIASSIGLVAVKGGIFAVATGFNYRVYGPASTQFAENNAFAIAVLMTIPLLILWQRETKQKLIKLGLTGALPLCFAAALSSWSRGALLTMGVLAIVLLWNSKRKYLAIPILIGGVFFASGALPEAWYARMHTVSSYQEDSSAMSRITTWTDGFYFAVSHPITGAGFEGWRYVTHSDWHSSYVEIMAEHGLIAFALWISMIIGSIISLTRLPFLTSHIPEMQWVKNYCHMLRASLLAYMAGTVFLGLSYWDILYQLIFISVLVKQFALQELKERTTGKEESFAMINSTSPHADKIRGFGPAHPPGTL